MSEVTPKLYEVFIVDSMVDDDEAAVAIFRVRALSHRHAAVLAILRAKLSEDDLQDFDVIAVQLGNVKDVVPQ